MLKNEHWVTLYYFKDKETNKMIECDINGASLEYKKAELKRRLAKFRVFGSLVGKLKAS